MGSSSSTMSKSDIAPTTPQRALKVRPIPANGQQRTEQVVRESSSRTVTTSAIPRYESSRGPKYFNSFSVMPEGMEPRQAYPLYDPTRAVVDGVDRVVYVPSRRDPPYNIKLRLFNGDIQVRYFSFRGPLTPTKAVLGEFPLGRSYRDVDYRVIDGVGYVEFTILYGETDDAPALFKINPYVNAQNETTTKVAKELIDALDKHTLLRAVSEVTMGPRSAEGPATETGKTPRNVDFQKLPKEITREIQRYVGGRTRRRKTRKHKRRGVKRT